MVSVLRPGQRILNIPAIGVQTSRRAVAAGGSADWWAVAGKTCAGAYLAKGAASYAASKVNLDTPGTRDLIDGAAYPTWNAATGWTHNGSSQSLRTGIVPANGYSMLVRFANTANNSTVVGEYTAGARFEIAPRPTIGGTGAIVYGSGAVVQVLQSISSGVLGIAGQQGYRNGTADGAVIGAWSATTTNELYIGNRNGADDFFVGDILAVAIYSNTLTAGEMATVSAAMAAL